MSKPGFFIIGAPKCGTTALAHYLSQHYDAFVSRPKEPHFFLSDFHDDMRQIKHLSHYEAMFASAEGARAIGEASVWYLYSESAIQEIYNYNPEAKVIVMLRNPVEMVVSLHSQKVFSRDEDEADFEAAWELCSQRREGNSIPGECREVKTILYDQVASYSQQLDRLYQFFPEKQVLVINYDDFKHDVSKVYKRTLSFLGLEDDGKKNFEVINANKAERFSFIGDIFARPPKLLLNFNNRLKRLVGVGSFGLIAKLRSYNTYSKPRAKVSAETLKSVEDHYRSEMILLSEKYNIRFEGFRY